MAKKARRKAPKRQREEEAEVDVEDEGVADQAEAVGGGADGQEADAAPATVATAASFASMALDSRLTRAILRLGWLSPTPVQQEAIPAALAGRDVLARARAGGGKTAAYALPLLQRLLDAKQTAAAEGRASGLFCAHHRPDEGALPPGAPQRRRPGRLLSREVAVVELSAESPIAQRPTLMAGPDIVVGTPARIVLHHGAGHLPTLVETTQMVIVDEADLVLGYGYQDDLAKLAALLPASCQKMLVSATLSADVEQLRGALLHDPVLCNMQEAQLADAERLAQYYFRCVTKDDKFLLIYALFKLRLVRGRTIVFVNTVDGAYRLRMFLEQVGVRSCVLNSQLPHSSREHVVASFNKGLYDTVVAVDEPAKDASLARDAAEGASGEAGDDGDAEAKRRRKGAAQKDAEYGPSRGIDFAMVANVINFDFPATVQQVGDKHVRARHAVGRAVTRVRTAVRSTFIGRAARRAGSRARGACSASYAPQAAARPWRAWPTPSPLKWTCGRRVRVPCVAGIAGQPRDRAAAAMRRMAAIEQFRYRVVDAVRSITSAMVRRRGCADQRSCSQATSCRPTEVNPRDLWGSATTPRRRRLPPASAADRALSARARERARAGSSPSGD